MKKLLIALLLVPTMAHAEFLSGNTLYQRINSTEVMDRMLALGYIMGVSDAQSGRTHCAPADSTAGQLRDVAKLYMEKNPAVRNLAADLLVMVALGEAFPCKRPQGTNGGKGA